MSQCKPQQIRNQREETILRPLVSYYGGKQRLVPKLIPLIPPHSVYVEPFAGGAALLFAKGRPAITNKDHYREVLNDKDNRIVTLYRVARERPGELIRLLQMTPYSRDDYRRACAIIDGHLMADELMVAWAVWVALQFSFANKLGGGFGYSLLSSNMAATHAVKQIELPEQCSRLAEVFIESLDALEILKKYDSPQTFFYCDPPYPGTEQGHYKGYTVEHFNALVDALENCQGSYMLSCYDAEGLRAPRDAERIEIQTTSSAARQSNNKARIEVVYRREAKGLPRTGLKLFTGADMVRHNK